MCHTTAHCQTPAGPGPTGCPLGSNSASRSEHRHVLETLSARPWHRDACGAFPATGSLCRLPTPNTLNVWFAPFPERQRGSGSVQMTGALCTPKLCQQPLLLCAFSPICGLQAACAARAQGRGGPPTSPRAHGHAPRFPGSLTLGICRRHTGVLFRGCCSPITQPPGAPVERSPREAQLLSHSPAPQNNPSSSRGYHQTPHLASGQFLENFTNDNNNKNRFMTSLSSFCHVL